MKKDTRKLELDPMEWRDAMRDVDKKATKAPPKKKPRSGAKRKKSR